MVDLKGMTKKAKVEYIWDYYKIHIIVTTLVLIGLVSFIHGQITKINYEFNLTIIGSSLEQDKSDKFEKTLTPIVIKNPSAKQSAQIDIMAISSLTGGKEATSAQYMQKFVAELSANVIDLLILNKTDYEVFLKQGAFIKLDDVEVLKDKKLEETLEGGEKGVYGINIDGNKKLTSFGVNTKDMVLCIPASTKQKPKAFLAIKWILENN